MFRRKKEKETTSGPLSVCLIGCGPAGMSLLHAVAYKKSTLDANSDEYKALPNITCYERAPDAGGVWRDVPSDDPGRTRPENKVLMYKDLWCNIPKEFMEYFDYTWDEHFHNKPTPSFLPRKDVLEYILARNGRDGALDGVKFNHTVTNVTFNKAGGGDFTVTVADGGGKTSSEKFDRCIWAGGLNSCPEKPADVLELLADFEGTVMHSSEAMEDWGKTIKGKHVVLIGDSSSAEDLALRALTLGVKQVTICARSGDGAATDTATWPGGEGKINCIYGVPYKVVKGKDFKCQAVYWSEKKQRWRRDDDEEVVKVKSVDVVVLCTGYDVNLDMIDMDIRFDPEEEWQISKGWHMDNNAFTISLGNVTPSKNLEVGATVYPDLYRGLLVSNPKMMYLAETEEAEAPLLELDINAWLILGYLTGTIDIPKEKDMTKLNQKQLEAEMQLPWLRERMDNAYSDEMDELDDTHWSENPEDERSLALEKQSANFKVDVLARDIKASGYPLDLGKPTKLSPKGQRLVDLCIEAGRLRTKLSKDDPDKSWMTFRDAKAGEFESLITGTKSVAYPKHWLDLKLDGNDPKLSSVM